MSTANILGAVGAVVGFYWGGPQGAQIGFTIGSAIGGYIDPTVIKGPKLTDATAQTSQEGIPIPFGYGTFPTAGNLIWVANIQEHEHEDDGKGSGTVQKTYTYTRSYAIGICEGEITGIQKAIRNGKLVYDVSPTSTIQAQNAKFLEKCTFYLGSESQLVDPVIEAYEGVNNTGPMRGLAYAVIEDDETQAGEVAQWEWVVQMCGDVTPNGDAAIYVGHNYASDKAYHVVNANTGDIIVAGNSGEGPYNYLTINTTRTRLYVGFMGGNTCGYINPLTGAETVFASVGGLMVVDANELYAYCGAGLGSTLRTIHIPSGVQTASVSIGTGLADMCIGRSGTIYTCYYLGGAALFGKGTTTYTLTGFQQARGICVDALEARAYISCNNGGGAGWRIIVVSTADGSYIDEFIAPNGGNYPTSTIAISPDGTTIATNFYDASRAETYIYSSNGTLLHTLTNAGGANKGVAFNLAGTRLYVTGGSGLYIYETDGYTLVESVALTPEAFSIAVWPPYPMPAGWQDVPDAPGVYVDQEGQVIEGTVAGTEISSCTAILRDIVEDLCDRAGIDVATEVDASELTDVVAGFKCATESGADGFIEALTQAFFFDRGEWDKKLRFIKRGGAVKAALTIDDLVRQGEGPPIAWNRIQEPELLRKVNIMSLDPAADYKMTKQSWERRAGTIKAVGEATFEIPVVTETDTAAGIAKKKGLIAWSETAKAKYGVSVKYSKLTPTDIVTLTDEDGQTHRVRINDSNEQAGIFEVTEAVKDRASVYAATAIGVVPPADSGTTTPGLIGPTLFAAMNLPQLKSADNTPGMYIGAAGMLPGWNGAQILLSVDEGLSYTVVKTINVPTKMGSLIDDEGASGEPITVRIFGGTLSSVTAGQVAVGANLSAIITSGISEILAYEDAINNTSGYIDLETITRGMKGTAAASHYAGDQFVDLNTAYFLPIPEEFIGDTLYFKAVAFGVSADAVQAVAVVYNPPALPVTFDYITYSGEPYVTVSDELYYGVS